MAEGYIFGDKFETSIRSGVGQYYIIGRVKKVVLGPFIANTKLPDPDYRNPNDIGAIKYEIMYSTLGTSKSEAISEPAYPMFSFIKHFPTYGEMVLIFPGPSPSLNDKSSRQQFFYMPPYDLWNHANHGAFPVTLEWAKFLNDNKTNKPGYSGNNIASSVKLPLGKTYEENDKVRNLTPFEGDTIIQTRSGQSIRFGSTVSVMKDFNTWSSGKDGKNGDPITIISNSQGISKNKDPFQTVVEDVNRDGSAIWMTSTQQINLQDINSFPLNSFGVGINPIIQNVVKLQQLPTSDETISAQFQDENSIK